MLVMRTVLWQRYFVEKVQTAVVEINVLSVFIVIVGWRMYVEEKVRTADLCYILQLNILCNSVVFCVKQLTVES